MTDTTPKWMLDAAAELCALPWISSEPGDWTFDEFEAMLDEDDEPGLTVSHDGGRLRMDWGSNNFECDVHGELFDAARRLMAAMDAHNIDPASGDEPPPEPNTIPVRVVVDVGEPAHGSGRRSVFASLESDAPAEGASTRTTATIHAAVETT